MFLPLVRTIKIYPNFIITFWGPVLHFLKIFIVTCNFYIYVIRWDIPRISHS
jgi:hypothetical protein